MQACTTRGTRLWDNGAAQAEGDIQIQRSCTHTVCDYPPRTRRSLAVDRITKKFFFFFFCSQKGTLPCRMRSVTKFMVPRDKWSPPDRLFQQYLVPHGHRRSPPKVHAYQEPPPPPPPPPEDWPCKKVKAHPAIDQASYLFVLLAVTAINL